MMCQGLLLWSVVLPYIKTGGITAICFGELYCLISKQEVARLNALVSYITYYQQ